MKRTGVFLLGGAALTLLGCGDHLPAPGYAQSRAINQDIEATHVVGPTTTSPGFTQKIPSPALTPWRAEETNDLGRQQTSQLPR